MMEFIIARVSACICAAIIIGMMFVPVTDCLMENADEETQINSDTIGGALDKFMSGNADEAVLFLDMYLPSPDSTISFNGRMMTMGSSDESYHYTLRNDTISDSDLYLYTDAIKLTKVDGRLNIERMVP